MPFSSGDVAYVEIDSLDVTPYIVSAKLKRKGKDERADLLGNNGTVTFVHSPETTLEVEGLLHETLRAKILSIYGPDKDAVAIVYGPQGNASGKQKTAFDGKVVDVDDDTAGGKKGMFTFSIGADGVVDDSGAF